MQPINRRTPMGLGSQLSDMRYKPPTRVASFATVALPSRLVLLRAKREDDASGPSVDWDGAWSSFQRQLRSQVEVKNTTSGRKTTSSRTEPRRSPPRRVSSINGGSSSWGGQEGERIRRAERVLVDLWSNADFLKAGTAASIILLVVFVLIVGPPPPDGRCSLFWC